MIRTWEFERECRRVALSFGSSFGSTKIDRLLGRSSEGGSGPSGVGGLLERISFERRALESSSSSLVSSSAYRARREDMDEQFYNLI